MRKKTLLATAGCSPEANHGIVNPPVYHASTVVFPTVAELESISADPYGKVYYGRMGTPTSYAFENAVAALEGADKVIAVQSGLAAITAAILAFVSAGDHILITDSAYFPTRKFCDVFLKRFGVETEYYDPMIGAGISDLIKDNTKLVFTESPGSLTFEVQDIPAICKAAHEKDCVVIIDNTWGAGLVFDAFKAGVDVSIQAATKYIVGHSDAMLGTIATKEKYFKLIKSTAYGYGYCAAPDDCYLGLRGIRSLASRMRTHDDSAMQVARWLKQRPEVARLLHPAFEDCPGHEFWQRDFTGSCGLFGVVLAKPYSKQAVTAMLDGMELFGMGYSWGGFESLILPTTPETSRSATSWKVEGPCLRLHIGQEDPADLIADLEAGFARLNASA